MILGINIYGAKAFFGKRKPQKGESARDEARFGGIGPQKRRLGVMPNKLLRKFSIKSKQGQFFGAATVSFEWGSVFWPGLFALPSAFF
jgi:hypothetical protein